MSNVVQMRNSSVVVLLERFLEDAKAGRLRDCAVAGRRLDGELEFAYEAEAGLMPIVRAVDELREMLTEDVTDEDLLAEAVDADEVVDDEAPFAIDPRQHN